MHENYDLEELLQLVEEKQFRRLRTLLDNMNWVDIAEFLDELGPEDTILVFRLLPRRRRRRSLPSWRTPTIRSA